MRIYYSGIGSGECDPEILFGKKAILMLTFTNHTKNGKPGKRMKSILKGRKRRKKS